MLRSILASLSLLALTCGIAVGQDRDPDLEDGFPVVTAHTSGTYRGGPQIHALVGNLDADPELEIVHTGLSIGPLYAWNSDGRPVAGWPIGGFDGAMYPTMGTLTNGAKEMQVFVGRFSVTGGLGELFAVDGAGRLLPGWPRAPFNYVSSPAALADVNGDGVDEAFVGEEDNALHAYRADGTRLPGWPVVEEFPGQGRTTPAIADLDGDGGLDIVTCSDPVSSGVRVVAYHADGSRLAGFPVYLPEARAISFPAIGDVDGDGALEIVVATRDSGSLGFRVNLISARGETARTWTAEGYSRLGAAIALADLDGDTVPEIVAQTDRTLYAFYGDGTTLPGWPVRWTDRYQGYSSPVVGDVDGDLSPDIVVTLEHVTAFYGLGDVIAFDVCGNLLPRFPKTLPISAGGTPAIADVDLDGHNEIVILGSWWTGVSGYFPQVWVYDLSRLEPEVEHGRIEWGQFMAGPRHQGTYEPACPR